MSFIGKLYKFEKQENFDAFVNSLEIPEDFKKAVVNEKPSTKLLKDGDTYNLITIKPDGTETELKFKSGVEFDQDYKINNHTAKTTITVEGNVVTQNQKFDHGATMSIKREFSDNDLVVTTTGSHFDGEAKRFYKAV